MADVRWKDCPVIIPYMGGKFELSKQLVPMLPFHTRYIEVFAGGLSMFYRKKLAKWTIVNDKDGDVANLYESVRLKPDEFCWHVKLLCKSRTIFEICKENIKRPDKIKIPEPKRAAEYYFVIKNAFNNCMHLTMSKDSEWNTCMVKDVMESKKKLDNITVENLDFRTLFEKYKPRKGDLWYLDPPYFIATERGDYYRHNFTSEDHYNLLNMVDLIDKNEGKFMISYDDKPIVHELYGKYIISVITTKYAGNNHIQSKIRKELAITNFKPYRQETIF